MVSNSRCPFILLPAQIPNSRKSITASRKGPALTSKVWKCLRNRGRSAWRKSSQSSIRINLPRKWCQPSHQAEPCQPSTRKLRQMDQKVHDLMALMFMEPLQTKEKATKHRWKDMFLLVCDKIANRKEFLGHESVRCPPLRLVIVARKLQHTALTCSSKMWERWVANLTNHQELLKIVAISTHVHLYKMVREIPNQKWNKKSHHRSESPNSPLESLKLRKDHPSNR